MEYTRDAVCCRIYISSLAQQRPTTSEVAIRHRDHARTELDAQEPSRTVMHWVNASRHQPPLVGDA
jgi:hypothetical protein